MLVFAAGVYCFCLLSLASGGSVIRTPGHFYLIDPNRSGWLDGATEAAEINLDSHMKFLQNGYDRLFVNKNGVVSFIRKVKGVVDSYPPKIAPLWVWLTFGNETGAVFYQQTSKNKILMKAKADVTNNFDCAKKFEPTSVEIITWYNMPIDPCTTAEYEDKEQYCDCLHTTDSTEDFEYCLCEYYDLMKYCECSWAMKPSKCQCHDYITYYYNGAYYCDCMETYSKKVCDCWADEAYDYLEWCVCLADGLNSRYCDCLIEDYEDYCTCVHLDKKGDDYCYCVDRHGEAYCNCVDDFYDQFDDTSYYYEFCECFAADKKLKSCLCPTYYGTSPGDEYCDCLQTFQSHFDAINMTHFDIHKFCLCYAESGDAKDCGCESCPTERALKAWMYADYTSAIDRREIISQGSNGPSVAPWTGEHNTFQAVIITDDRNRTFVMFNYESLNVPQFQKKGKARPATVGFDSFSIDNLHQFSKSPKLYNLLSRSNVGVNGRWLYRVDGAQVKEPTDC